MFGMTPKIKALKKSFQTGSNSTMFNPGPQAPYKNEGCKKQSCKFLWIQTRTEEIHSRIEGRQY